MQNKELTLQKSMTSRSYHFKPRGFSLVELLLVLGIISIMASIVINSFSNAAQDSRNVLAKQQQAPWQSAVNNWVGMNILILLILEFFLEGLLIMLGISITTRVTTGLLLRLIRDLQELNTVTRDD